MYEMPAGCASSSCVTNLGGSFHYGFSVALDNSGNLYATDLTGTVVDEFNRATKPAKAIFEVACLTWFDPS